MTANGKVFVCCIALHTKPQKIWDARAKVLELVARETFFIRGKAISCNTDCPLIFFPGRGPARSTRHSPPLGWSALR